MIRCYKTTKQAPLLVLTQEDKSKEQVYGFTPSFFCLANVNQVYCVSTKWLLNYQRVISAY